MLAWRERREGGREGEREGGKERREGGNEGEKEGGKDGRRE